MTDHVRETVQELSRIRKLPYNTARTVAAEQTARRVEADGPPQALAYALFTLVESYVWGGEPEKAFVAFAKATRLWDSSPELFDDTDRANYFWAFKWMVGHLADYPEIPAAQIEATLADMAHRYAVAGNGSSAIAYERYRWARHRGTSDEADLMAAWSSTPRDDFSQCAACSLGEEADYHRRNGRLDRAIELVEGAAETTQWCATEPAGMQQVVALAHLELGHSQAAVAAYQSAAAALEKSMSDMADTRGLRFEFLARAAEPTRALRALRDDAGLLHQADTPYSRLRFLLPVLAGLSSFADPDQPVNLPGLDSRTVAELRQWVEGEARTLAAAFDARNETDHYQRSIEAALGATVYPTRLDFAVITPSPKPLITDAVPASEPGSGVPELLARAEGLAQRQELREAAAAYQAAAALADTTGDLIDSGFAHAEAARCAEQLGDELGANHAYAQAAVRLRAADVSASDRLQVLSAWAPLAVELGTAQAALTELRLALQELFPGEGVPQVEEQADAAGRALASDWAQAADLLARTLASGSQPPSLEWDEAIRLADAAARVFACQNSLTDASHAFWLAGRLQQAAGDQAAAQWSLESAFEGFGLSNVPTARAEAGSDLIEVLRASGQEQQAEAIGRALTE